MSCRDVVGRWPSPELPTCPRNAAISSWDNWDIGAFHCLAAISSSRPLRLPSGDGLETVLSCHQPHNMPTNACCKASREHGEEDRATVRPSPSTATALEPSPLANQQPCSSHRSRYRRSSRCFTATGTGWCEPTKNPLWRAVQRLLCGQCRPAPCG